MSDVVPLKRAAAWSAGLRRTRLAVGQTEAPPLEGSLTRMVGLTLEAAGCQAAVGDYCDVIAGDGSRIESEVVGFAGDRLYLMPAGDAHGLGPNARVIPRRHAGTVHVGEQLLGRIVDGSAQPLDGLGPLGCTDTVRLTGRPINPLARQPISAPLDVGVRAINSLLTIGRGQRVGLFAGSGVGKSMLLGMMARYTSAQVIVVGLIGERGREVKEFVERILGPHAKSDEALAARIEELVFVFDNLLDLDDRGMQELLRQVSSDQLLLALKGTDEPLKEKMYKNMSQRAAEMLKDDLEAKGPVRVSEVEGAQKEILKLARKLAEAGTIALGGKGEQFV